MIQPIKGQYTASRDFLWTRDSDMISDDITDWFLL